MKKLLVVHNYFGPRRVIYSPYVEDNLFLVKKQVEYLSEVKHNLDKIVFTVNSRGEEDSETIEKLKLLVPSKLQQAEVEILIRENVGLSYGAFSDVYRKYRTVYDYYFFTEDDYFFVEDWFDSILIDMLNENVSPGYLCGVVRDDIFEKHAGNSVGVASSTALEAVFIEENMIPHNIDRSEDPYEPEVIPSQVLHTNSIFKKGYSLTDIRETYTLYHVWPNGIERSFPENDREIIKPIQRL